MCKDVTGKNAIIIDDEISTAGTLCEASRILTEHNVNKVYAACTHGVLCGAAIERIESSPIEQVVITDTVPFIDKKSSKIKIISSTRYFAKAIQCVQESKSLSNIYD